MSDERLARLLLTQEIAEFLYAEAELLDERHHDEWLDLLAEDIRYWMPMRRNVKYGDTTREFTREGEDISWLRAMQIELKRALDQHPEPNLAAIVSETDLLVGKREDTLRRLDDSWLIARRKIILDQNVLMTKNLTFFF